METAVAKSSVNIMRPTPVPRARVVLRDVNQPLCSTCSVRGHCLSHGVDPITSSQVDQLVSTRLRLHKGDALYRPGTPFLALYAIHSGSLKSVLIAEDVTIKSWVITCPVTWLVSTESATKTHISAKQLRSKIRRSA
jgi:CRP-like cAMP-binding protein